MTEVANLQSVTARFQRLVGRFPAEHLTPYSVSINAVPDDLSEVLNTAYANNPALFAAFEQIQASEASSGEAKAGNYPILELNARHGTYKNNNSFDNRLDAHSYGNDTVVELRIRYNLYRGGSDSASQRAAISRINQAAGLRDKACVDIRQSATIAHSDIHNLLAKLEYLSSHREKTADVLATYRKQFDTGRRSLLDVLDSQNEFYQAERAHVNGLFDLEVHRLQTLYSMGRLLDTLAVNSTNLPDLGDINKSVNPGSSRYCTAPSDSRKHFSQSLTNNETEEVLSLGSDALFDVSSTELKPEGIAALQNFVMQLLGRGAIKNIKIIGHTDSSGSDALNQQLSIKRAVTVRDALINNGLSDTIMLVSGVGSSQPIAANDSPANKALNRRVEIKVTYQTQ